MSTLGDMYKGTNVVDVVVVVVKRCGGHADPSLLGPWPPSISSILAFFLSPPSPPSLSLSPSHSHRDWNYAVQRCAGTWIRKIPS